MLRAIKNFIFGRPSWLGSSKEEVPYKVEAPEAPVLTQVVEPTEVIAVSVIEAVVAPAPAPTAKPKAAKAKKTTKRSKITK